ncbi:MAG TPA: malto-oligosyltrehalose synthase [Crenalkalicoccus sp.]|nr:malto-oligosyltrehalose synthase [Crenalkalicoccus sp.]
MAPPPAGDGRASARGAPRRRKARRHREGEERMKPLSATARLQFHKDFTLEDATNLVPYFERLGVSHLYASPLLKARAGSTHGYDIVNHNEINPELGGEDALHRLVAALRARDMGLILDIVPNHMGVGGNDNAWWLDVLEWGRASPYAEYFDIDWDPPDPTLRGRLLAPFLGSSYGECLEKGELVLKFDESDGRLFVAYYTHRFPIAPRDYAAVLLTVGGPLEAPARLFAELGPGGRQAVRQAAKAAREELLQPAYAAAIQEALRAYSASTPEGRERLHRLLERQHYRLAWWRAAADEINWRRFFDINGLAGVRQEVPDVFEATHRTIFRLYTEGLIDGVRIDHVDGLGYPREYCRKLRRRLESLQEQRPPDLRAARAIIWVEKILAPHERLAQDWLTDGTTGYDFMSDAAAVLHDPAGETPLTQLWTGWTGRTGAFEIEAQAARRQILRESLSSELFATVNALHRIARRNLRTRDYTLTAIYSTLIELLVHFHTYRIYAGPAGISEADQRQMDWAMAGARRTVRTADLPLLELVGQWLSGTGLRGVPAGTARQEWLRAMVKFQQLSAPTAAKSVEDTAFYRYGRLLSRNEVGSEPSQFAITPPAFHAQNKERQRRLPLALLATATHDHKRGEDTRIRLAVISEIPAEWEAALQRWTRLNASLKRDLDGPAPDPADEIMLYQTLVAAWPLDLRPDDAEGLKAYEERVAGWQEKALREAKLHSSWAAPNAEYEAASRGFLAACLDPARPVCAEIAAFADRIAPHGAINGLTQTLLRVASPGIPDLYQGTEFWDLSLVDPDNRRKVDFSARQGALEAGEAPPALLPHWRDGRVKQAIIGRSLAFRGRAPGLFTVGAYQPLRVEGPAAEHILAFLRVHEGRAAIAVGTRLSAALELEASSPLVIAERWRETSLVVPKNLVGRTGMDVLTDSSHALNAPRVGVISLLTALPVALLEVR